MTMDKAYIIFFDLHKSLNVDYYQKCVIAQAIYMQDNIPGRTLF
jgi:hypothetical protein